MNQEIQSRILAMQRNEITEYHIYTKLANMLAKTENGPILRTIGEEEKKHHDFLSKFTGKSARPKGFKVFFFVLIARILGITFALKLMERGEEEAQEIYDAMSSEIPEAKQIIEDEDAHEEKLLQMLKEERLEYVGSIVLGLNDALVELTGALAGLSFALQNTRLIAVAGLITGIAASFSMAASEYLSNRTEGNSEGAVKSAIYTGIAYILTVGLLILPYLLLSHYMLCLAATLGIAILIIFFFNYYVAVAKDLKFWPRFTEMALLSLGVAAISFGIGVLVRSTIGIDL
jgi:VIT1/CCC1 family predicted Fe2+/Mn2+ transporter